MEIKMTISKNFVYTHKGVGVFFVILSNRISNLVLFFCCYLTVFWYALREWFLWSLCRSLWARCEHKKAVFLPFLTCANADIHLGAWWAGSVNWSRTKLLWRKRQGWLLSHISFQTQLTARLWEGQCQHNGKAAMHFFTIPLEKLSQVRPNTAVTRRLAFFSSFLHLPLLQVNKPQMLCGIPQARTPQLLLHNQPEPNPSKYPHPSYKQQLPADPF